MLDEAFIVNLLQNRLKGFVLGFVRFGNEKPLFVDFSILDCSPYNDRTIGCWIHCHLKDEGHFTTLLSADKGNGNWSVYRNFCLLDCLTKYRNC